MHKILLAIFIAGLFAGCSSPAAPTSSSGTARGNVNSLPPQGSDPSANGNADPQTANRTLTRAEMMEKLRQKSLNAPVSNVPLPKPQFKAAPENSVITTTMNGQGAVVETRIFKNDPQLAKVEMTWNGPKDATFKIFLKNGRSVETKADKIQDLASTPASVLVQMAGVK